MFMPHCKPSRKVTTTTNYKNRVVYTWYIFYYTQAGKVVALCYSFPYNKAIYRLQNRMGDYCSLIKKTLNVHFSKIMEVGRLRSGSTTIKKSSVNSEKTATTKKDVFFFCEYFSLFYLIRIQSRML